MNADKSFTLTSEHITLLRRTYVGWSDVEYGAPWIDPKRPYGNSSVAYDIAEILGWDVDAEEGLTNEQRDTAAEIHRGTQQALQILIATGACEPGQYVLVEQYNSRSWRRVP